MQAGCPGSVSVYSYKKRWLCIPNIEMVFLEGARAPGVGCPFLVCVCVFFLCAWIVILEARESGGTSNTQTCFEGAVWVSREGF